MSLSSQEIQYLNNKHKGGVNFSKGSRYESYYTVYQVALLFDMFRHSMDDVMIKQQVPLCFVDDLMIMRPDDTKIYHQLKNVKNLSWNTQSNGHTIESDFVRQEEISDEQNEAFFLKLVYSDADSSVSERIPSLLRHTGTEYFPYEEDINGLMWTCNDMDEAFKKISSGSDKSDRINLAAMILGALVSLDGSMINLKDLYQKTIEMAKGFAKFSLFNDYQLSDESIAILDNIPDIQYTICGNILRLRYKCWDSEKLLSSSFERELMDLNPTDFNALTKILLK